MITLATTNTLQGKSTNATAVTYTTLLLEISTGEVYKNVQGQLPSSAGTLYTVPASTSTLIREILLTETSGVDQVVTLFVNGTASANRIAQFTTVANGMAILTADGIRTYDPSGKLLSTSTLALTGDVTGSGSGSIATTIGTNVVDNTKIAQMAQSTIKGRAAAAGTGNATDLTPTQVKTLLAIANTDVSGLGTLATVLSLTGPVTSVGAATTITANAVDNTILAQMAQATVKGRASGAGTGNVQDLTGAQIATISGAVTSVTNADGTVVVTGTGAAPIVSRAAITGDVLVAAAGNASIVTRINGTALSGLATGLLKNTTTTGVPSIATAGTDYYNPGGTDVAVADGGTGASTAAIARTNLGIVQGLNGAIDVTQVGPYVVNPVLTSNAAATNNTNLTAIMAAAPSGSILYFPGGFYPFASVIAIPAKVFVFQGSVSGVNGNLTALEWTSNVAGDLITLTGANYYSQFKDMGFLAGITQTAGAVINTGDNANTNFYRCTFGGLSTFTLHDCINYTGTHAGEISHIVDCVFGGFSGTGIIGGSNLSTVVVDGCTMNGAQTAACGINVQIGGAFQIDNSDIIGCTNNLLINPIVSTVVASVFVTNSYFDSSQGSCIKITGAGASVRTKFSGCSFTTAASSSPNNAVEVSSTFAYGSLGMGLDFVNCNVLNTFGTLGSGTGFNITGAADFNIIGCNIAAWGVGIDVTPANSAGMTQPLVQSNSIGPCGGYGGNTIGIRLNAGSFAYGQYAIQDNNLQGNTTTITDNSTLGTGTAALGQRNINGNTGLVVVPTANYAATAIPTGSVATNVDSRGGILIPAGTRPSSGRIIVYATNAATAQTLTVTAHYGTNNSNADAAIYTQAHTIGTTVIGSGMFMFEWELLTSTTMGFMAHFWNGNNAATGITGTATPFQLHTSLATPATIATTANSWLGIYFLSTAAAITIRSVKYELQSQ